MISWRELQRRMDAITRAIIEERGEISEDDLVAEVLERVKLDPEAAEALDHKVKMALVVQMQAECRQRGLLPINSDTPPTDFDER